MAHEIRTPLTTIRTLTRSLLRRQDVGGAIAKRLQRIDQECTQQIDRFNLIFRAAELASSNRDRLQCPLAPIALAQVFQEAVPQWQQQAYRRNLDLKVTLPPQLPRVNSDPTLLHQVLTGVVEWFTQGLPAQSQVQMQVTLAGHQLKLQFAAEAGGAGTKAEQNGSRLQTRSLGQLLTVAPDTGGVSLNLDVTKTLFQALGGKLIVRQRPQQGEVLTVFLPLETREV
jgi:signal transduction histidine kinase